MHASPTEADTTRPTARCAWVQRAHVWKLAMSQTSACESRRFPTRVTHSPNGLLGRRAALAFLGLSPALEVLAGHENRTIQRVTLRRG